MGIFDRGNFDRRMEGAPNMLDKGNDGFETKDPTVIKDVIKEFIQREKNGTLPFSGREDKSVKFYHSPSHSPETNKYYDQLDAENNKRKQQQLISLGFDAKTDEEIDSIIRARIAKMKEAGDDPYKWDSEDVVIRVKKAAKIRTTTHPVSGITVEDDQQSLEA